MHCTAEEWRGRTPSAHEVEFAEVEMVDTEEEFSKLERELSDKKTLSIKVS